MHLGERAVVRCVPAGDLAAEHVARTSDRQPPSAAMPSSRSPAGLSRTTEPSASTWRIRSVAPSTMAPSSSRSRSSASRSRAPCERDQRARGGRAGRPGGRPRRGPARLPARARAPLAGAASDKLHVAAPPGRDAAQRRRASMSANVALDRRVGSCDPTAATRSTAVSSGRRATAPAGRVGQADELEQDGTCQLLRGVPPEAISWLSWYWANSASASRWASSNARRLSRSSASIRLRSVASLAVRPLGRPRRPASRSPEQEQARHRSRDRGGRWTVRRAAGRGRAARRGARVERIPRAAARTAAAYAPRQATDPPSIARAEGVGGGSEGVEDRLVARRRSGRAGRGRRPRRRTSRRASDASRTRRVPGRGTRPR